MVIPNVVSEKANQLTLTDNHDMIEHLSPYRADPALRRTVLPGTPKCGPARLDAHPFHTRYNFVGELRIPVEDKKPRNLVIRKCFSQLLDNPIRARVGRDVDVKDLPT